MALMEFYRNPSLCQTLYTLKPILVPSSCESVTFYLHYFTPIKILDNGIHRPFNKLSAILNIFETAIEKQLSYF